MNELFIINIESEKMENIKEKILLILLIAVWISIIYIFLRLSFWWVY